MSQPFRTEPEHQDGRDPSMPAQLPASQESRPTSSSSRSLSPTSTFNPTYNLHGATTPLKFASSTNAFNLAISPTSSNSSREGQHNSALLNNERSPPQAGTSTTRRLRRPSMLSLAQPTGPAEVEMAREDSGEQEAIAGPSRSRLSDVSPTDTRSNPFGFGPATSRWNTSTTSDSFFNSSASTSAFSRAGSEQLTAPAIDRLKTEPSFPLRTSSSDMENGGSGDSGSPMDMETGDEQRSPLRFLPPHLQTSASRRKGKGKMDDLDLNSPHTGPPGSTPHPTGDSPGPLAFHRKPLPASLVATLISENAPLEHEIQSEARLQRFIHSHPPRPPLTPRISKSTRGRFPEMADNDDDEDDTRRPSWRQRQWLGMRSDSDTDSDDDGEPVNSAFAAGMDLDRPMSMSSSTSSAIWPSANVSDSGKMTPGSGSGSGPSGLGAAHHGQQGNGNNGHPTPPPSNATYGGAARPSRLSFGSGMIPSPGNGFQLPGAFGSLGVGGGTPLGSPTIERLELGASPSALSTGSPSLMQYRESQGGSASVRPGKRKGWSRAPVVVSTVKGVLTLVAQQDDRFDPYKRPRGSSPSLTPMSPSQRAGSIPIPSSPFAASNSARRTYAPRPLSSRSRQASPALSIGSTSGVLSTSLGTSTGKGVGGSFIPTGPAATHAAQQVQGPQLGGLGLLSLANVGEDVEGEGLEEGKSSGPPSRSRSGSRQDSANDAMEED